MFEGTLKLYFLHLSTIIIIPESISQRIHSLFFISFSYIPTLPDMAALISHSPGHRISRIKWTFCPFFISKFDLFQSFLVSGKE